MNSYPLSTSHFIVEWGGTRIGATEVLGLAVELEPIEYREGASKNNSSKLMPGKEKANSIILRRGIIKGDNEYYDWLKTVRFDSVERRDLKISLLNENHEPVVVWKLKNAFPIKIEWSPLKADGNEVAIESLEVVHEGLEIIND